MNIVLPGFKIRFNSFSHAALHFIQISLPEVKQNIYWFIRLMLDTVGPLSVATTSRKRLASIND